MTRHTPGNYVPLDVNYVRDAAIRRAGEAAELLFIRSLAYAKGAKTRGHIPDYDLDVIAVGMKNTPARVAALVKNGLWTAVEGGWTVRSWDRWNAEDDAQRDESSAGGVLGNHVKWHVNRGLVEPSCAHCASPPDVAPESGGESAPDIAPRSHPESQGKGREVNLSSDTDERADVETLCQRLADRIEANGANRPEVTKKWRTEARRMLDLDKRELERALRLIDWCQADPFWRANILSMPTFRQKYDQLRLKATAEWEARKGSGMSPDGDVDPELVLGPDSWTIPDPPEGVEPGTPDYTRWARRVRDEHKAERVAQARERLERRAG